MPTTSIPTIDQLKRAIQVAEQIARLQAELNQILGSSGAPVSSTPVVAPKAAKPARKKGKMSAAGRAAIVAAQKARWAKIKGTKTAPVAAPKAKAKRKISTEARARMAAAAKRRWANKKGASAS
jgi:hypothetical protein